MTDHLTELCCADLLPIARPAFRANHALMMRRGERGLRTYLAGFEHGTT
jgi:hypothetical protein